MQPKFRLGWIRLLGHYEKGDVVFLHFFFPCLQRLSVAALLQTAGEQVRCSPVIKLEAGTCSWEHYHMPPTPKALQDILEELEASRVSRKRAWEILQEIRWVLKDTTGIELPPPARKAIDLEGRLVKDAVCKSLQERQKAIGDLIKAIREYRKLCDQPLTLRGSEYAHAVLELNKAIDWADNLL
jgi:hypothetical protein